MQPKDYKDNFFEYHLHGAISSAEVIIPLVEKYLQPVSVIDIGCGIGAWLSIWEKRGLKEIMGVDGLHVDKKQLRIKAENFTQFNLEEGFKSNKKYELVTCLEVAEHLPEKSAGVLIKSLCMLGDVILFSAAIPGQEGTLHINEQYPEYWINLFNKNGYIPIDCLRLQIWNDKRIQWWYRQNILFFVKEGSLADYPKLKQAYENNENSVVPLVHPELFEYKRKKADYFESVLHSNKAVLKYFFTNFWKKKNG